MLCNEKVFAQLNLCDSLFKIDFEISEGRRTSFENESQPFPIIKLKKYEKLLRMQFPDSIIRYNSEIKLYLRFIVDIDSLPKCIEVFKSKDIIINTMAIEQIKKIKYIPAKRNGIYIPYFMVAIISFKKKYCDY
jgi:hypothetical protein